MRTLASIHRVLVPTALGRRSEITLEYAHHWAGDALGLVSLLHVFRWDRYVSPDLLLHPKRDGKTIKQHVDEDLGAKLSALCGGLSPEQRARTRRNVEHGLIVDKILEQSRQADLLMMEKTTSGGPHFHASIVAQVLSEAMVPVLVHHGACPWPIRKILVATFGSDAPPAELNTGVALAKKFNAELTVLQLVPTSSILEGLAFDALAGENAYESILQFEAERDFARWLEAFPSLPSEIVRVAFGEPLESLHEALSADAYDLLVVGARAPGTLEHGWTTRLRMQTLRAIHVPTLYLCPHQKIPSAEKPTPEQSGDEPMAGDTHEVFGQAPRGFDERTGGVALWPR